MKLINRLRLIFGIVWLLVAAGICVYQVMHPESGWLWMKLGGTPISLGWAALLLGVYNLARWWASRASMLAQKKEAELAQRDSPRRARRREEPPSAPDPNFDFSDKPPAAGEHPNGRSHPDDSDFS
jgi:hypothetical protein